MSPDFKLFLRDAVLSGRYDTSLKNHFSGVGNVSIGGAGGRGGSFNGGQM